ncbi:CHASE domain-containing protein [Pseudomonas zhanjiangensis]|uniref:histidine kinase n=1 Tax=Pseudomonas zhanjiangensis TaxID=3239015 RepID=A0ABV3YRU2_9PSED
MNPSLPSSWRSALAHLWGRRNLLAWGVLLVSLGAVLLAWNNLRLSQASAAAQQFDLLAKDIGKAIRVRMTDHEKILLGGAGLFDASREVSRQEWRTYITRLRLAERYPGILGVGFSQVLAPRQLGPFEAGVRAEGFGDFRVHPPGERQLYSSILYLEPFSGRNLAAFGYDMLSEPTRQAAMLAAAESGETRVSGRVTLLQETHGKVQAGLLMYVPIYHPGRPLNTAAERLQALRGFVYSPYRMNDLMAGILGDGPLPLDFELYAGTREAPEQLLFSTREQIDPVGPAENRQQLHLYGQTWTLNFHQTPAFAARFVQGQGPLLGLGACISLLLFSLVSSLSQRRERAQELARQMTGKLREQEQSLRLSEERLGLALKGSNDGWWDLDLVADTLFYSPRGAQMLGYSEQGLVGGLATWEKLVVAQDLAQAQSVLQQTLGQAHTHFTLECRLQHRDGHPLPVLLRGYIQYDEHGRPLRLSGTTMDLSELKRIEQMKNAFVSTVSHELRTPLTSIAGALGLINGGALGEVPAAMRRMLDIAQQNSQRLGCLINDLLDMDKLLAGKMTFELASHPLDALLEEALTSNQAYADKHQVTLQRADCPPIRVKVDAMRLQQVLANFLSNAIKFSPSAAQVQLRTSLHGQWVRVSVCDQGAGVPEAFRPRIFQKFSQADGGDNRQKGGTGLGLAISKELIERMGGRVGFDSVKDQGATFWFELPVQAADPALPAQVRPRLLVVEDVAETADYLRLLLSASGYEVVVATTLTAARREIALGGYAAVTLDLLLPDGNGLELLRDLRGNPLTETLPVLVISGATEQPPPGLSGGFQAVDWLDKPIDQQRLLSSLRQALHGLASKPRVLHIEDDADLRQVIAEQGRRLADFVAASSLAQARRLLNEGDYDLILLDIGLPDGNGLELLEELHQHHPALPVVVLSAHELDGEQLARVEAALAKSRTDAQHFLQLLGRLLPAKERQHA